MWWEPKGVDPWLKQGEEFLNAPRRRLRVQ